MEKTFPVKHECGFAPEGTYGHECGKPAVTVCVSPSDNTTDGLFYSGRCALHANHEGRDNRKIIRFEPFNGQANRWI